MENNPEDVLNPETGAENPEDMDVITLSDVVLTQQDLLADVCAVLGASDDKNCTYSEGYVKRQALYACLTCIPEAKTDPSKRAGICLACTYHCHDGHELIELYTKRNFRCDCGNSKFPEFTCNLCSEKDEVNELNQYNQNFSGLYCTCARPYPDPDDEMEDEMIQCVVCEDWLHTRHIGVEVPNNFAEMICENCVKAHEFFLHYDGLTITKITPEGDSNTTVNVEETVEKETPQQTTGKEEGSCKKPKEISPNVCAKFMKDLTWRQQLCTCDVCLYDYTYQKIVFLIDPQDTVQLYEDKGKEMFMKKEEDAFNSIDRVPLMEAIAGYNDLKDNLSEFLMKFAKNKKIVRAEDVQEFFSEMKARKKQKTSVQHFCR